MSQRLAAATEFVKAHTVDMPLPDPTTAPPFFRCVVFVKDRSSCGRGDVVQRWWGYVCVRARMCVCVCLCVCVVVPKISSVTLPLRLSLKMPMLLIIAARCIYLYSFVAYTFHQFNMFFFLDAFNTSLIHLPLCRTLFLPFFKRVSLI